MTLTIRNINQDIAESYGYCNINNFPRLLDSLKLQNQRIASKRVIDNEVLTVEDANDNKVYKNYFNREQYPDYLLDTGSDSVMEYSIMSHRNDTKRKNSISCIKTLEKNTNENNNSSNTECVSLKELNESIEVILNNTLDSTDKLLMNIALNIVKDAVEINKYLGEYDSNHHVTNKIDMLRLVNLFDNLLISKERIEIIESAIDHMRDIMSESKTSNNYEVSTKEDILLIIEKWKELKYFPKMLFHTILCQKYSTDCKNYDDDFVFKVIFATMGLELSKMFINMMAIMDNAYVKATTINKILRYNIQCFNRNIL
ncbi:hypothetical protein Kpol_385p10 [Vanderwaltozyma polyspora DSM 70294]|uniref:Uncharacterized protein n=1 Tax=Vanderwaltozyma polyspora (strain ATCC 22028 / DSM 70294 / BCRC 21397 / CBS 2163 / NBRC 10782 / NRRL Y-8283 / UCD 57-17) TaxID=436907 RepID=A7TS22_VANPO|nr:uncharacterized protein Kpol_385p10 [Vanderwaltozyma polyspora DSM 70294]EDO14941.1 hypothetical protein Kpol_385p10 [Vanderwaltozyma polyspora DSM 70294]